VVPTCQSGFNLLAADPLKTVREFFVSGSALPASAPKNRVEGCRQRPSGRLCRRGRGRSMFTPGSRACGYKTASGLGKWPNKDPLNEFGFHLLTTFDQVFVGRNSLKRIQRLNWYIRGPGSPNLYAFSLNDPIDQFDSDGEDIWVPYPYPGHYVSDPPPPPPQYPQGFSLCRRDYAKDPGCSCSTLFGNTVASIADLKGGVHTYVQYVGQQPSVGPTWIWGYGFSGPAGTAPESHFNPNSCKSCSRSNSPLKFGSGSGKTGSSASDQDIMDCIVNSKPTAPYNKWSYNCKAWAKEAASNCGLDCN